MQIHETDANPFSPRIKLIKFCHHVLLSFLDYHLMEINNTTNNWASSSPASGYAKELLTSFPLWNQET